MTEKAMTGTKLGQKLLASVRQMKAGEAARTTQVMPHAAAVRSTRKKLGLNQAQAGQLFGGGATAFSEYERGKTQPHKSTLLLLKLLDRHPDLLDELAG